MKRKNWLKITPLVLFLAVFCFVLARRVRQPQQPVPRQQGQVMQLAFSPDGHKLIVVWYADFALTRERIEVWDIDKGRNLDSTVCRDSTLRDLASGSTGEHPNVYWGNRFSVDNSGKVWNWNLTQQKYLKARGDAIAAAYFISDGNVWIETDESSKVGYYDGKRVLRLRSVQSGKQLNEVSFSLPAAEFDFIADTHFLFVSDGANLYSWNRAKKKMQFHVKQPVPERQVNVPMLALAMKGQAVVWGCDGSLDFRLLNAKTGKLLWRGESDGEIWTLAVSPNGDLLATGQENHLVKLWDLKKHKLLRILRGHKSQVVRIAFSPDVRTLASGDWTGHVLLWRLK